MEIRQRNGNVLTLRNSVFCFSFMFELKQFVAVFKFSLSPVKAASYALYSLFTTAPTVAFFVSWVTYCRFKMINFDLKDCLVYEKWLFVARLLYFTTNMEFSCTLLDN